MKDVDVLGVVSLDENNKIIHCHDPRHENAWFVFRPGYSRWVVYNGEIARTVCTPAGDNIMGDIPLILSMDELIGLDTIYPFKPADNERGKEVIREYLDSIGVS